MGSYPSVISGDFGDEKVTSSTRIGSLPLGIRMRLPDGRIFAHAQAGGTALAVGMLCQTLDTVDDLDTGKAVAAAAVGDTSITITLGDTATITLDQFRDGYLTVTTGTGYGHMYKIKGNAVQATTGLTCKFDLEPNDAVKVLLAAGTSTIGVHYNEFDGLMLWEAGTVIGMIAGIPPVAVTEEYYFWVQRQGACNALAANSLVLGSMIIASDEADGSVGPVVAGSAAATARDEDVIGYCMGVAASASYGPVYLTME